MAPHDTLAVPIPVLPAHLRRRYSQDEELQKMLKKTSSPIHTILDWAASMAALHERGRKSNLMKLAA